MQVQNIRIEKSGDRARLSARLVFSTPGVAPFDCWFDIPVGSASWLNPDSGAFHMAGLMIAMRHGEAVEWDAPTDLAMRRNIDEFQRVYCCWYPKTFRYAAMRFSNRLSDTRKPPSVAGCFFSSGIDAMHTAYRVRYSDYYLESPENAVLIPVIGLDLNAESIVQEVLRCARAVGDSLDWPILPVRTNVKELLGERYGLDWTYQSHGIALISVGYAISNGLSAVHFGSTNPYNRMSPEGSTPRTDELWTSNVLRVLHVGAECSRVQKIDEMAQWDTWKDYFRVCFNEKSPLNCGRCPKCVRTMYSLDACGLLERVSGRFKGTACQDIDQLVGMLWTKNLAFVDLLAEIAARYRNDGRQRRAANVERLWRHLSPSPFKQAVRDFDRRCLGGALNRVHTLFKKSQGLKNTNG